MPQGQHTTRFFNSSRRCRDAFQPHALQIASEHRQTWHRSNNTLSSILELSRTNRRAYSERLPILCRILLGWQSSSTRCYQQHPLHTSGGSRASFPTMYEEIGKRRRGGNAISILQSHALPSDYHGNTMRLSCMFVAWFVHNYLLLVKDLGGRDLG